MNRPGGQGGTTVPQTDELAKRILRRPIGPVLLRLAAGGCAAFEMRALLGRVLHAFVTHPAATDGAHPQAWVVAVMAFGAAVALREMMRGLIGHLPQPVRSWRFVAAWLMCSASVIMLLSGHALLQDMSGTGGHGSLSVVSLVSWQPLSAALITGFGLASALCEVCSATRDLLRAPPLRFGGLGESTSAAMCPAWAALLPRPQVADGWPTRGPPIEPYAAVPFTG